MKIDVAKQIVEIILDLGEVRIPGLGNFRIEHKPAKLSSGKTLIGPPEIDVLFDEESGESIELLNRVKKTYKLRKNEAEKVVDTFSQKVLNNLVNFDRVRITGLGMLGKGENNTVDFTPNKGFVKQYYKGLPEVPTQITGTKKIASSSVKTVTEKPPATTKKKEKAAAIKKTEETKAKSTPKSKKATKSTKPKKTKRKSTSDKEKIEKPVEQTATPIPPVVIPPIEDEIEKIAIELKQEEEEVIATPIYASDSDSSISSEDVPDSKTLSSELESETVSEEPTGSTEKEEPIITYSSSSSSSSSLVESKEVVNPLTEPYHPPFEEEKSSLLWPILILCLLVIAGLFGIKKCSSTGDNQTPELVRNETLDSVLTHFDPDQEHNQDTLYNESENLDDESSVETGTDEMVNEDETLTANPDKCIIITGVFKSDRNAKRMIKELKTGGYIPYAENYGEYLRVGFEFDCQDTELEDFIRAVRMNISKDAWYLQPAIEVF